MEYAKNESRIEEDEESQRKLLESSQESHFKPSVSTTNEIRCDAHANTDQLVRKKFQVNKIRTESDRVGDESRHTLAAAVEWKKRNGTDDDDDDDAGLSDTFASDDVYFKKYREAEGQDTVTSLASNMFKKQLENMKKKSMQTKKRANSSSSSSNSQISVLKTAEPIDILRSIFDSQEDMLSKKQLAMLHHPERALASRNSSIRELPITSRHSLIKESPTVAEATKRRESISIKSSKAAFEFDQILKKTESIASREETFSQDEFIKFFISNFKLQQTKLKKRKDKAKRLCLFAQILVFIGVFLLTVIFTRKIFYHIKVVHSISKINGLVNATSNITLM